MNLLLLLTNRPRYKLLRLALALAELCRAIAAGKTGVKKRFARFFAAAASARTFMTRTGSGLAGLTAAFETAGACLERTYLDMELHGIRPDSESREALLFTARAVRLQTDFLARPGSGTALSEAAKNTAFASKGLAAAIRAVSAADGLDFIANLKFSRIYSGLEKTARAVEECGELLAKNKW